ncbi:MAG TPA: hypothetical protein VK983_02180, partial [Candidatus Limnocylindrales bacterium]|nr:hypothetical protein [Candidatus Limnocylindrales bacterium]
PIAIVPLVGNLLHLRTAEATKKRYFNLHKFLFTTAVGNGQFGLEYEGLKPLDDPDLDMLVPGDIQQLSSHDIHSITDFEVGKVSTTAWRVVEGLPEDKPSLLFSKEPKPTMDASQLYKPASKKEVERVITHTLDRMKRG